MCIIISSATDRYDLAHLYLENHKATLRHYKVSGISSISSSWKYNPNAQMVIAICPDSNEMLGAVRLEIFGGTERLPMVEALKSIGHEVDYFVSELAVNKGLAELCGLWCKPGNSAKDLPKKLIKAALEYAKKINISHIIGFANEYSLPTVQNLGFTHVDNLENEGIFCYPTKQYKTYVVHYSNAEDKKAVLELETVSNSYS